MEINKLIKTLNGMVISSENDPSIEGWVKDFLTEIKTTIEKQEKRVGKLEQERNEIFEDRNMWIEASKEQQKEIIDLKMQLSNCKFDLSNVRLR